MSIRASCACPSTMLGTASSMTVFDIGRMRINNPPTSLQSTNEQLSSVLGAVGRPVSNVEAPQHAIKTISTTMRGAPVARFCPNLAPVEVQSADSTLPSIPPARRADINVPSPMFDRPCPVCHLPAFSASGTHPQCLVRAAERVWDVETRRLRRRQKTRRRKQQDLSSNTTRPTRAS
jgi:hypothetical protein